MRKVISEILESSRIDSIDSIVHISDVHIRNYKRHEEYQIVFDRVHEYCREAVRKNKNTVIVYTGDIVHAKTDMSPELVSMTRTLLKTSAEIAPTVLIPGNHDCNLNNTHRLDALSPIVESIDNDELYYLKDTGIYHLAGIDFIHNSIYDDPDDFISSTDVDGDYIKIALFHGAVDKARTDQGIQMKNNRITTDTFAGFDFVLLGDIHSFQYLDADATIAYPGSLIQQNFGESLSHGIIHWNLLDGTSKFVKIDNDWGYYTLDVEDGSFKNLPKKFSKNNRVRVRSYGTANADLVKLITSLKASIKVEDIRIQKFSDKGTGVSSSGNILSIGDVRDIAHQNNLITEYIDKNFAVDADLLDEVAKINRKVNSSITKTQTMRNIIWKPIKFEFDNMFSYGEGNVIDFTDMNGTYGLFAPNASGKSSLLDALMFCIFDKCSRTFKASQVLNNKKDYFTCKFKFNLSGKDFYIERTGKKDKRGHVKVNVDFWRVEDDGTEVSLNGDDRDGTNFAIRDYLGTYDDFVITALSLQSNNTNFIDKQQRERKDLLSQFLDLNIFEEMNSIANEEIKSVKTLIKEYTNQDYSTKIAESNDALQEVRRTLDELNETKEDMINTVEELNAGIIENTKKIKEINDDIASIDIDEVKSELREMLSDKAELEDELKEMYDELSYLSDSISRGNDTLSQFNYDSLLESKKEYDIRKEELIVETANLKSIVKEISHYQSSIDNLDKHEYDPDCEFCTNNIFVKDAIESKEKIKDAKIREEEALVKVDALHKLCCELGGVVDALNDYNKIKEEQDRKEKEQTKRMKEYESIDSHIKELMEGILEAKNKIAVYNENENTIVHNNKLQLEISKLELNKENITKKLHRVEESIIDASGQMKVYEKVINDNVQAIKKLKELEREYVAYDYYLKATHRDGVPYDLISEAIPKIQAEVNGILSQIVDFGVLFETDGKSINTYIVYDDQNFWPLEMTSGMEKFISSLAIRTALINVSALPRPNFIAIDEGFGVLDSENLNSLHMFFDYMKTHFDFILTISHLDALRDIMDNLIEVKKHNGFSNITF